MNSQWAVVGTEVLAYAHMIADMEILAIADVRTLLQIDGFTALGKQVLRATVAQPVRHRAEKRYGGLRQAAGKNIIDYQPKCSHVLSLSTDCKGT